MNEDKLTDKDSDEYMIKKSIIEVTPEGEYSFYCNSLQEAANALGVGAATVKYAHDNRRAMITRRTIEPKFFRLEWLTQNVVQS